MNHPKPRLLILDACVLIDYCDADATVLSVINRHVGVIHVAAPVFAEVEQLDEDDAVDLGLQIVVPEFALLDTAANTRGTISFQDRLCLLMAKEKGWTCVTNDTALRTACTNDGVPLLWGLEPLVLAVECGALSADEAIALAKTIQRANRRFITEAIVERFISKVRAAE